MTVGLFYSHRVFQYSTIRRYSEVMIKSNFLVLMLRNWTFYIYL